VHNDFRPDNMMFATAQGGRPITVLDWQSLALGAGPVDLGYFLAGALPAPTRRAHEAELLARYHQGLSGLGVSGYDVETLRRDYAGGAFRLLMTAFVSSMRVRQTDRGDRMFLQMAHSAADHIHDHQALAFLEGAEPAAQGARPGLQNGRESR
jgi:aminoglycoside phosphotransferase (APT) family kinase protein